MNPFKKLSVQENTRLLKFPAYISLLAANNDNKMDEAEKKAAIKIAHTKSFTCDPLLAEFFKKADEVFEKNIEKLNKDLPKEKNKKEAAIKKELINLEKIVQKLGNEYSTIMHQSMKLFTEQVSKSHHSVIVDFILPITIPGLSN